MAKQDGIIKIRGTVDNLTFARTKDGSQVRKKKLPVSELELQNSPKYARLRENMSEFNRAISAGKILRLATADIAANTHDKRLANRMTTAFKVVVNSDTQNKRGLRTVVDGDITLVKNFNFNPPSELSQSMKISFPVNIDRVSGKITADIPSFIPENVVSFPTGATHFMIHSSGMDINFGSGLYDTKIFISQGIPLGTDPTPAISILHQMAANSTNPLLLMVGIRFYQEVNGVFYPLRNSAHNALTIVEVSRVN